MATEREAPQHGRPGGLKGVADISLSPLCEALEDVMGAWGGAEAAYSFTPGGSFILDVPAVPPAVWGRGSELPWSDGEALLIAGGQGLGKTTLAQQLALGRCGVPEFKDLLGFPVAPGRGRTLYLAMDRPKQAARSFRRMVGSSWRAELDERLIVWEGPPPGDMATDHTILARLCRAADADTVVVDSLKDAAVGLVDDKVGAAYNRARQLALRHGVQVLELHHNRKRAQDRKGPPSVDDVYGSTWLTSGAGSVLLLEGAPGDALVTLHHLKQPAMDIGPLKLFHDHSAGRSSIAEDVDLVALAGEGLTARAAARALFGASEPTANQVEKARRKLANLEREGLLKVLSSGSPATRQATVWGPA